MGFTGWKLEKILSSTTDTTRFSSDFTTKTSKLQLLKSLALRMYFWQQFLICDGRFVFALLWAGWSLRQTCSPVDNMRIFQLRDKFPITVGLEHNFQQLHCFTFGESSISPFGIIAPRLEMKTTIFRMDYCQRSASEAYFQKTLTCFQKAKSPPNKFFFKLEIQSQKRLLKGTAEIWIPTSTMLVVTA